MTSSSPRTPIKITYAGPEPFINSPLGTHLRSSLAKQLPLRNLHWKPVTPSESSTQAQTSSQGAGPSASTIRRDRAIRTIQTLDVRLIPLADELRERTKPEARQLVSRTLLQRPFVHLYFVVCEDNDNYRTVVRNDIRSWLSSLSPVSGGGSSGSGHARKDSFSSRGGAGTPPSGSSTTPTGGAIGTSGPGPTTAHPTAPEFLIVLVNPPAGAARDLTGAGANTGAATGKAAGMGRFYNIKGSVVDKLRADFNSGKRERVIHLTRLPPAPGQPGSSDPTLWAEALSRLKECASAYFDAAVGAQEDDVRRLEINRGVPGWNYCGYFASKECLAHTFEGVDLCDDALAQYEELEATFFQCLRERTLSFFAHIGGLTPGDDSAPLLDVGKKPYRDLILRNEVTLFDFRCYVFARRAALLGRLGRVAQVMRETPGFLAGVGRMLSEGETLPCHFIESWTFSSSLDVVEQCQAWLIERGDATGVDDDDNGGDGHLSPAFHAAKAELLDLARRQLDKIGVAVGHLPRVHPFTMSLHGIDRTRRDLPPLPPEASQDGRASDKISAVPRSSSRAEQGQITRTELLRAIESREVFDLHYVALTERVVAGWMSGGRIRNVLRLRAVLASLDYHRERFAEAYTAFTTLPEPYAEARWGALEAHLLVKQLECHARLSKPRDRAWVSVVVALLRTRVAHRASLPGNTRAVHEHRLEGEARWADEQNLFEELRAAAATFEKEVPVSGYHGLSIRPLADWAAQAIDEDGSTLQVSVVSSLDFPLPVDDVRLCLTSRERDQLWFTSGRTTVMPGRNEMVLSCPMPASGYYLVDVSQIRIARVIFQYAANRPSLIGPTGRRNPAARPHVIKIPEDGEALDVHIDLPREIHLDRQRCAVLEISPGRNHVERAVVSIVQLDGRPVSGLREAELLPLAPGEAESTASLEGSAEGEGVTLRGLPPHKTRCIRFPIKETSPDGSLRLMISIDYWTAQRRPHARRQLRRFADLVISLPLGVNVQDFLRVKNLFSKFSISAGGTHSLRLRPARLEGAPESLDVSRAQEGSRPSVVVTPRQPASYVFRIQHRSGPSGKVAAKTQKPASLRLVLVYRTLQEEARRTIMSLLEHVLKSSAHADRPMSFGRRRCFERALTRVLDERLEMPAYALTGELRTGPFDQLMWTNTCRRWGLEDGSAETEQAVALAREVLALAGQCGPRDAEKGGSDTQDQQEEGDGWRVLSIPVDVPHMSIVNAVTLDLARSATAPLIVGRQVEATISILTTFAWAGDEHESEAEQHQESAGTKQRSQESQSDQPRKQRLAYDVQGDFENWLVSGSKRGAFVATAPEDKSASASAKFTVTLIPLRHGSLVLPTVSVRPLPPAPTETPPSAAHVGAAPPPSAGAASTATLTVTGAGGPASAADEQSYMAAARRAALPSCETYQVNAASRIEVLPLPLRSTFWVDLPDHPWDAQPDGGVFA